MPNRIIKESIWTSPNLNQLSIQAERHFYRLMPCPDDHGCCECTSAVIRGKCYPLQADVTIEEIEQWQRELESQGLILRWTNSNRQYAIFPTFSKHQRIRSLHNRKTPVPPPNIISKCQQVASSVDLWSQLPTNDDDLKQKTEERKGDDR